MSDRWHDCAICGEDCNCGAYTIEDCDGCDVCDSDIDNWDDEDDDETEGD